MKRWAFKVQFEGRRRTFSLPGRSRAEAARQAHELYQAVIAQGWDAAASLNRSQLLNAVRLAASRGPARRIKSNPGYWEQRLIQRRYHEGRLGIGEEYSVRIEEGGAHAYFPLGTMDPKCAAARARDIHAIVLAKGWTSAFEKFEREFTLAIFWADNPAAVTYTTLFTFLNKPPASQELLDPLARPPKNIIVLEPEPTTHSCLRYWLDRQPGFGCAGVFASARAALEAVGHRTPALVLVNRVAPDMKDLTEGVAAQWPAMPLFPYRIHEESDQIFISISGVTGGYIFRRRVPTALFEPLRPAARLRKLTVLEAGRQIRSYFQNFFGDASVSEPPAAVALTDREQEILNHVSRGCLDKEIAELLQISIWTVHNHVKNIYEKLGVHHRTEAILKYLQR